MKSPYRLNVALTRAKDGLAVFEDFRSIFKAVRLLDTSENSFGKALSHFIADAVARRLVFRSNGIRQSFRAGS